MSPRALGHASRHAIEAPGSPRWAAIGSGQLDAGGRRSSCELADCERHERPPSVVAEAELVRRRSQSVPGEMRVREVAKHTSTLQADDTPFRNRSARVAQEPFEGRPPPAPWPNRETSRALGLLACHLSSPRVPTAMVAPEPTAPLTPLLMCGQPPPPQSTVRQRGLHHTRRTARPKISRRPLQGALSGPCSHLRPHNVCGLAVALLTHRLRRVDVTGPYMGAVLHCSPEIQT